MRRVPLNIVELLGPTGKPYDGPLLYSEALVLIAKTPIGGLGAPGGVSDEQMEKGLAVEKAVEASLAGGAKAVLLEEAEWAYLAERVKAYRWPFAAQAFRDLIAAVVTAEPVNANAGLRPAAE